MTKTKIFIGSLVALVLLTGSAVWLYAQQVPTLAPPILPSAVQQSQTPRILTSATVSAPTVTPSVIAINTPTTVIVTVLIPDASLVPGGVNLLRLGATGAQPTVIGVMHDDGLSGDLIAGDQIYTLQVAFNEVTAGQIQLQVSAAFKGVLKRSLSTPTNLKVWKALTNSTLHLTVDYPPDLSPASDLNLPSGIIQLRSSLKPLLLSGGALPPNTSESDFSATGYEITISGTNYDTNNFQIDLWLKATAPNSSVASMQNIMVAGTTSYEVIFSGELDAETPVVIVPRNGMVYTISYDSTFDSTSAEEQVGLASFNTMLQTVMFQ